MKLILRKDIEQLEERVAERDYGGSAAVTVKEFFFDIRKVLEKYSERAIERDYESDEFIGDIVKIIFDIEMQKTNFVDMNNGVYSTEDEFFATGFRQACIDIIFECFSFDRGMTVYYIQEYDWNDTDIGVECVARILWIMLHEDYVSEDNGSEVAIARALEMLEEFEKHSMNWIRMYEPSYFSNIMKKVTEYCKFERSIARATEFENRRAIFHAGMEHGKSKQNQRKRAREEN